MTVYRVKTDGEVQPYAEDKLREALRDGDLTGLELVRAEHATAWTPLHDLPLYAEEVPHQVAPRVSAQLRVLRGFALHAVWYVAVCWLFLGFTSTAAAIWGIFVALHAVRVVPPGLAMLREGNARALLGSTPAKALLPPVAPAPRSLAEAPPYANELAEVRGLLQSGGHEHALALLSELDELEASLDKLWQRERVLAREVGDDEQRRIEDRITEASQRLDETPDAAGRSVYERQLAVLRARRDGIAQARRSLERLRVQRQTGEEILKQLRLDLHQRDVTGSTIDIGRHIEQVRFEVEALEEVENALAGRS